MFTLGLLAGKTHMINDTFHGIPGSWKTWILDFEPKFGCSLLSVLGVGIKSQISKSNLTANIFKENIVIVTFQIVTIVKVLKISR